MAKRTIDQIIHGAILRRLRFVADDDTNLVNGWKADNLVTWIAPYVSDAVTRNFTLSPPKKRSKR